MSLFFSLREATSSGSDSISDLNVRLANDLLILYLINIRGELSILNTICLMKVNLTLTLILSLLVLH